MSDADDLLRSGDLDGARAALVEAVKARPGDAPTRMFLFQLLALAGEWNKARIQLDTLARLSPEAAMLAAVYGQAIDAEAEREAVFAGTAVARQHVASEWADGIAQALHHAANSRPAEAEEARARAFDAAPDTPGVFDGYAFDWIADADARFGPCFEAVIGGRYGLQPFDRVERIESEGPLDLRDLVWYPVQIAFRDGRSIAALLPARYPGSHLAEDGAERLTRATGWREGLGSGQHLLALSTGEERGLLSLRLLTFG
jgi:type VI secretion system protein ImpE